MNSEVTSKRVLHSPFIVHLQYVQGKERVDLHVCLLCCHWSTSSYETKVLKTKVWNTENPKDSVNVRSFTRRDYAKTHVGNPDHEKSVQNVYKELLKFSKLSPADLNFDISTETKIIVLLYVISIVLIALQLDVTFENARLEMLVSQMISDILTHIQSHNQTGSSAIWPWSTIFTTPTSKKAKDRVGPNVADHSNQQQPTHIENQSSTYDENNALSNGTALLNSSSTPFGNNYNLTNGALIKELGGQVENGADEGSAREGSYDHSFHNIEEIAGKVLDEYLKKLLQDSPCNPNDLKNTEINFTDYKNNQDNDAVSLNSCSTSDDYHISGNHRTHKNESGDDETQGPAGEEIMSLGLKQDRWLTESNRREAQMVLLNNSAGGNVKF